MPSGCYERKALEDLKGADYLLPDIVGDFPREDFPIEERLQLN
jgi:hypothetical protein